MAKSPRSTFVKLHTPKNEPRQDVIAELENALEYAKSGDLRSVAVVGDIRGERYYAGVGMEDAIMLLGHLNMAILAIADARMKTDDD